MSKPTKGEPAMGGPTTYAAFLRAVNLGARRKLPMATVRRVLPELLGYQAVRTYIASGNLVVTVAEAASGPDEGTDAAAARHAAAIAGVLGEVAGFEVPTVVLTRAALGAVLTEQPFTPEVARHVTVGLVQGGVDAGLRERLEGIADRAVDGEGLVVGARAFYLHLPHSVHASRLAGAYGRVAPEATARNLATMRAVAEIVG